MLFDDIDKYPEALDCARKTTNLHLMAKDAAFFAGEQKNGMIKEIVNTLSDGTSEQQRTMQSR